MQRDSIGININTLQPDEMHTIYAISLRVFRDTLAERTVKKPLASPREIA